MPQELALDQEQQEYYRNNGYLIIRNVLSPSEVDELCRVLLEMAQREAYPPALKYPAPGKYTICGNQVAQPQLAAIAEHPTIVHAV